MVTLTIPGSPSNHRTSDSATASGSLGRNLWRITLHAYGEKDPRVKIDHWTRLEAQLRQHAKDYESVSQRRQGHGFRDEKASVGFYGQLEDFLARNLEWERGTLELIS